MSRRPAKGRATKGALAELGDSRRAYSGNRVDLDQRVRMHKAADRDQRAGWVRFREVAESDFVDRFEVRHVFDEDRDLHDVVNRAAELTEISLDVHQALLRLGAHIATAHELVALVVGELARDPDKAPKFGDVHTDRAAERDGDADRVAAAAP